MLARLDHVAIAVRDLAAATHHYAALLGRSPSWRGTYPGQGIANTFFKLDRGGLDLISPVGDEPAAAVLAARLEARGEGLCGLAFASEDLGATLAALRAGGLELPEPARCLAHDSLSGAFRQFRSLRLPPQATAGIPIALIEDLSPPDLLPPAQAIGDPRAVVAGIDHIVVFTQDPSRAIRCYRDRLGLRLALDQTFEKRGLRLLFFRVGGVTLEVGTRIAADAAAAVKPDEDELWGLAWRVADADAARERMLAAGLEPGEPRAGHKPGTRVFAAKGETHGVATLCIEPARS